MTLRSISLGLALLMPIASNASIFPVQNEDQIYVLKQVVQNVYEPIKVCWGWSCARHETVKLNEDHWRSIDATFSPRAQNSRDERKQIQKAIALMETIVGNLNGVTKYDKGFPNKQGLGQTDCVDESINTTRYLKFLAARGLLRFHTVSGIEVRLNKAFVPFLGQHYTATIRDEKSSTRYVVDAWWFDNGKLPVIQTLSNWKKRSKVTNTYVP